VRSTKIAGMSETRLDATKLLMEQVESVTHDIEALDLHIAEAGGDILLRNSLQGVASRYDELLAALKNVIALLR
jgi:ribosomal protein S15P/S13E